MDKAKFEGAQPVEVPREVFEGIEAVRQSGFTNMLAREVVADLAEGMGAEESARWIRENRDLYARAIFHGFRVVGDGPDQEVSE